MYIKAIAIFLIVFGHATIVIGNTIKAKVVDRQAEKLKYFTVAVLCPQDSSILSGGAFMDGYFEFSDIKVDNCLLQISCVGYQTVTKNINFTQNTSLDLGTIQMDNLELGEVTVFAKRPVFKQVKGKVFIDVKGTSLSQAGGLFDALKRSPGIIVDNDNNITVFGKGTPIVFINGREVHNKAEIEALQSDDIANIEIDRNPSVEYSASGNAVVKIKTKKILKDLIKLQLYNRSDFARKYRNLSGIQFKSNIGKVSGYLNYSFGSNNYEIREKSYEINKQSNYTINNSSSLIRLPKEKKHNLFISLNQEISKKSALGFQYSYVSSSKNQKSKSDQIIKKTNNIDIQRVVDKYRNRDNDLCIYNLNYKYDIDSINSLSVIGDYTRSENHSIENILEQNLSSNSRLRSLIDSKNEYDIYGSKLDFKTRLFRNVNFNTGIKLSKVTNNGYAVSANLENSTENYRIVDKISDYISAAYFKLKPKVNNFNLEVGLRYEYTSTDISSGEKNVIDSTYGNWFPSILINKKISDKLDVTLSYSKKISRPSFDELSTDIIYFDFLSYKVGNPKVKSTIIHNVGIDMGIFNNLFVNFAYRYEKNARILGAVSDEVNANVVKYTPVNVKQAEYLNANIDYNYLGKKLNATFSLGGEKPFIEVLYLGEYRKIKNVYGILTLIVIILSQSRQEFLLNFRIIVVLRI
ncbi:MAG: TonB-dependent receptor [Marinifilum sp.]|jgi:outer membrane receptor protein involved in Fe transport|nr:TonB-dependent receptor [Marinifilum sp.]